MTLFEDDRFRVSQGFLSGWKIENLETGAILVPNWLLKERIGLVWMKVRRTQKSASVNSHFTEREMFKSFAIAVADPVCPEGRFWADYSPDEIASVIIDLANNLIRN